MTKKHFIAVADALRLHLQRSHFTPEQTIVFTDTINALCDTFEGLNSRFDRVRFWDYITRA